MTTDTEVPTATDEGSAQAGLFEPDHDRPGDPRAEAPPGLGDLGGLGDPGGSGGSGVSGVGWAEDEPPRPINWNLLTAEEAESEWLDLNAWVHWLRATYGLPPTVLPPYWHRHDELVWELSALHTHWLNAYDPDGSPSSPMAWHRDFADARHRLREWVSTSGTKLDRDRPTRPTTWPGEHPAKAGLEVVIEDREADFLAHVMTDLTARRQIADRVHAATRTH